MNTLRKNYSSSEKVQIVLELLRGEVTQNQITAKYGIHSTQLYNCKKQALEGLKSVFSAKKDAKDKREDQNELIEELYKQIGQLKVELDWLKKKSELFG